MFSVLIMGAVPAWGSVCKDLLSGATPVSRSYSFHSYADVKGSYVSGNQHYAVGHSGRGDVHNQTFAIRWQEGKVDRKNGQLANGAFVEDILIAVMQHLHFYQETAFKNQANKDAIQNLENAVNILLQAQGVDPSYNQYNLQTHYRSIITKDSASKPHATFNFESYANIKGLEIEGQNDGKVAWNEDKKAPYVLSQGGYFNIFSGRNDERNQVAYVRWQNGPVDRERGALANGAFDEDIMEACRQRLMAQYKSGASDITADELSSILEYIEAAIRALSNRTAERKARNVLGKAIL